MKRNPRKRGQRATSNIFAMFDQAQIQEFKEVSVVTHTMKYIWQPGKIFIHKSLAIVLLISYLLLFLSHRPSI